MRASSVGRLQVGTGTLSRCPRSCRFGDRVTNSSRLDAFQRRHPWASFPIAVIYKFADDQGPYLAALITYYGFLSLFPMLLLLASILGFVLQGNAELRTQILDSTLSQFPVLREELGTPQSLRGSVGALVAGGLVALYGALGAAQAMQNAMNVAWAVPRNRRPSPIRARLRSLRLIGVTGLGVIATTILSALASSAGSYGVDLGGAGAFVSIVIAMIVNALVFILAFKICTADGRSARELVPGALVAAGFWQLLQLFGAAYVGNVVKGAGVTYGTFALVLGLLAWIFLAAFGIVIGAEVNVVRSKRLYPRALLTPFTDNVDLTAGDRRAYTDAAQAQRFKGFQRVEVSYDNDGQHASSRRGKRAASVRRRRGSGDAPVTAETSAGDESA